MRRPLVARLALLTAIYAIPEDAIEAHKYACGVLLPRFVAAMNDWHYHHPQDPPGRPWEHCRKLDAADAKRWRAVRESFRELEAAMRRAGY